MKVNKKISESSFFFYLLAIIIIFSSFTILKYRKQISKLTKYEILSSKTENWFISNTILRERVVGKRNSSLLNIEGEDSTRYSNLIVVLFDYNYCLPCLKRELSRLNNLPVSFQVGIFTTPKNKRELITLDTKELGRIENTGFFNPESFWTSEMTEVLIYLKIVDGIVHDAILVDESFSDVIDKWIKL